MGVLPLRCGTENGRHFNLSLEKSNRLTGIVRYWELSLEISNRIHSNLPFCVLLNLIYWKYPIKPLYVSLTFHSIGYFQSECVKKTSLEPNAKRSFLSASAANRKLLSLCLSMANGQPSASAPWPGPDRTKRQSLRTLPADLRAFAVFPAALRALPADLRASAVFLRRFSRLELCCFGRFELPRFS